MSLQKYTGLFLALVGLGILLVMYNKPLVRSLIAKYGEDYDTVNSIMIKLPLVGIGLLLFGILVFATGFRSKKDSGK